MRSRRKSARISLLVAFEGMLTGWGRQQGSRLLSEKTIADRIRLVRRFTQFAECYPWVWGPGDVEDFTPTGS